MIDRKSGELLIADSFQELAKNKSVKRITIKETMENCGYTQPMFHYYYANKYDLINQIFQRSFDEHLDSHQNHENLNTICHVIADTIDEKRDFYENCLKNLRGSDTLQYYCANTIYNLLFEITQKTYGKNELPERLQNMLRFYVDGICSLAVRNITGATKRSPSEIITASLDALPSDLDPYLKK